MALHYVFLRSVVCLECHAGLSYIGRVPNLVSLSPVMATSLGLYSTVADPRVVLSVVVDEQMAQT